MRVKHFFQSSYWASCWMALTHRLGWDVPAYVLRLQERERLGDEVYIAQRVARLHLAYGVGTLFCLIASVLLLAFGSDWTSSLLALMVLASTVFFGIRFMRVNSFYEFVAISPGMKMAWEQLPQAHPIVAQVASPLMVDYWDAVSPLGMLPLRERLARRMRLKQATTTIGN